MLDLPVRLAPLALVGAFLLAACAVAAPAAAETTCGGGAATFALAVNINCIEDDGTSCTALVDGAPPTEARLLCSGPSGGCNLEGVVDLPFLGPVPITQCSLPSPGCISNDVVRALCGPNPECLAESPVAGVRAYCAFDTGRPDETACIVAGPTPDLVFGPGAFCERVAPHAVDPSDPGRCNFLRTGDNPQHAELGVACSRPEGLCLLVGYLPAALLPGSGNPTCVPQP